MNIVFLVMWLLSGAFTLLFGAVAVLYIRRTLQVMRSEREGSIQERILDEVEHVNARLDLLQERLERMEGLLDTGAEPPAELGSGSSAHDPWEDADR